MQRPLGPRNITRSSSPLPINLTETQPLNILRKSPNTLSPPTSGSLGRSQALSRPHIISNSSSRPATPKPAIRLTIPEPNSRNNESSIQPSGSGSPLFGTYYGGPGGLALGSSAAGPTEERTIRPTPSVNESTCLPQKAPEPSHDVRDVKGLLDGLNDVPTTWSDEVLEEISRLGEGAGGAVQKVKVKRTGKIIARKTITTREAPMKQLLRELSIISSTEHVNIILFHGAYMSPSSSEVKILMEYCEGGSLESVGKRIKERGAIVGEKIAGRLAEGVSLTPLYSFLDIFFPTGFARPRISAYEEDYS